MASPYIGEIRVFGGNFAPAGWAMCDGQTIAISQNAALFSLLGTTYGGDGTSTFNLPDLRGRSIIHQGTGRTGTQYNEGQAGGAETVTVTQAQMPSHNHNFVGSNVAGTSAVPGPTVTLATTPTGEPIYDTTVTNSVNLAPQAVGNFGGSQPHDNRQPYLAVTYIISLFGIFPSRN